MTAQLSFPLFVSPLRGLQSLFNLRPVSGIKVYECTNPQCSVIWKSACSDCPECGYRLSRVVPNYRGEEETAE